MANAHPLPEIDGQPIQLASYLRSSTSPPSTTVQPKRPVLRITTDFASLATVTELVNSRGNAPIVPPLVITKQSQRSPNQASGSSRRQTEIVRPRRLPARIPRVRIASSRGNLGKPSEWDYRRSFFGPVPQESWEVQRSREVELGSRAEDTRDNQNLDSLAKSQRENHAALTNTNRDGPQSIRFPNAHRTEDLEPDCPVLPKWIYFLNAPFETPKDSGSVSATEHQSSRILNNDAPPSGRLAANLTYVPSLPAASPVGTERVSHSRRPSTTPLTEGPEGVSRSPLDPTLQVLQEESSPLKAIRHSLKIPSFNSLRRRSREAKQQISTPKTTKDEQELPQFTPRKMIGRGRFPIRVPSMPQSQMCVVCSDQKHLLDFPVHPLRCKHPPQTCRECFQKWISTSMESNGHDRITCSQCTELLEYDDMKALASVETFERFDTLITRALLSAIPNFIWCPSITCNSGQVHTGNTQKYPVFTCGACSHTFCTNHSSTPVPMPLHRGETCQAYENRITTSKRTVEQIAQELRSERAIEQLAKRCPGMGCGCWIEKAEGCDHMTCAKCRWEFCWLCLADYERIRKQGNAMHKGHCPHYA